MRRGAGTFAWIYLLHILTTILIPIGLFEFNLIGRVETLVLIVLLTGIWAFIGAAFMGSQEIRQLKRLYLLAGIILIAFAGLLYVTL
jgi:hypothetical protein